MEDASTDKSSGASVVSLNSMTQASLVVRALRSHKSSRERYQDCSGNTMDVKTLNSAILNVKKEHADQSAKKAELDMKIDKWSTSSTVVGKLSSKDDSDKDDSDEEEQHHHKNSRTAITSSNADDDFDFDDDPEENRELFKDFVAPKGSSSAGKSSTNSFKSGTKSASSTLQQPSLVTSKGIVIKPGQAIRVKAHGNRSKQGSTSDF